MDLNDTAAGLLKAAFMNNQHRIIAGLQKDKDQDAFNASMEKVNEAEQLMIQTLTDFKQSIIDECRKEE